MLPARRTIPACKPEYALQGKRVTGMTFMIWGVSTVMTVSRVSRAPVELFVAAGSQQTGRGRGSTGRGYRL